MWSDEELVNAVAVRNQEAFSIIYDRYATLAYPIILHITKSQADSEDLLHALFMGLPTRIARYKLTCHCLKAWVLLSARKLAIDHIRSLHTGNKPLHSDQDILEMVYFEGRSVKEIASRLNTPLQTVQTQIRAAITSASPLLCR